MRRRELLALVCGSLLPTIVSAQSGVKRVGILMSAPLPPLDTLKEALAALGYRNEEMVRLEERFAGLSEQRYPALAAELVASGVDLMVTWGTPAVLAAKQATSSTPIVTIGAVASLGRPGGNVTGVSTLNTELEDKRLEILQELVPRLARLGILSNATSPYAIAAVKTLSAAAGARGLKVEVSAARDSDDLDAQLANVAASRPDAVVVVADSFLTAHHRRISRAMAEARLPAIYGYREAALGGGLIAYGTNYHELFRRAAGYIDKILKGADPARMPIEQPSRFEMIVNMQAAKRLGLAIPESFLLRADEVVA